MIDFIDLFAGLVGIRIGFTQAAIDLGLETRCVFTSEIKESALCALNPSAYFVDNEDWNITPDSYLYEHI